MTFHFAAAIFAYGQTGSGKTHTMYGDFDGILTPESGLIPRITADLFRSISPSSSSHDCSAPASTRVEVDTEFSVKCGFLEIYNETLRDLLGGDPKATLRIRDDWRRGVWVEGLRQVVTPDARSVQEVVRAGTRLRAVGSTHMNSESSRSHAVFMLMLQQEKPDGSTVRSTLSLVDLAGSERVTRSGATGAAFREAANINKSLSVLGNCISALTDTSRTHVPYRDSKLTHLLRDSLGGNTKTHLILTVSPSASDADETLSTLRFGARAQNIRNTIHVNQELSRDELRRKLSALMKYVRVLEAGGPASQPRTGSASAHVQPSGKTGVHAAFIALQEENARIVQELAHARVHIKDMQGGLEALRAASAAERADAASMLDSSSSAIQSLQEQLAEQKEVATRATVEAAQAAAKQAEAEQRAATLEIQLRKAQGYCGKQPADLQIASQANTPALVHIRDRSSRGSRVQAKGLERVFSGGCRPAWQEEGSGQTEAQTIGGVPQQRGTASTSVMDAQQVFSIPKVRSIRDLSEALRSRREWLDGASRSKSAGSVQATDTLQRAECSEHRPASAQGSSQSATPSRAGVRERIAARVAGRRARALRAKESGSQLDEREAYILRLESRLQQALTQVRQQAGRLKVIGFAGQANPTPSPADTESSSTQKRDQLSGHGKPRSPSQDAAAFLQRQAKRKSAVRPQIGGV